MRRRKMEICIEGTMSVFSAEFSYLGASHLAAQRAPSSHEESRRRRVEAYLCVGPQSVAVDERDKIEVCEGERKHVESNMMTLWYRRYWRDRLGVV